MIIAYKNKNGKHNGKTPAAVTRHRGSRERDLERREVEKRIYGVERMRLTASAFFLLLEYLWVLNTQ